jgi:serine/threonine protein kinase
MNPQSGTEPWLGRAIGDHQRYRVQDSLGGGSMGDVFLAIDTRVGQSVALKILKGNWVGEQELHRRFEHEVALCAALKGDHIVRVSDYGITDEGSPFYVMEYLQGQTLGQLFRQEKRLSVNRAVNIITQVCKGLELAHQGVILPGSGDRITVVHRDLKPENIFLIQTSLGELVKILDFGIAKIHNEQRENTHQTQMFIGTFHYASPEQVEVLPDLDGRSDIYSLGVILYELLSGLDPFGLGIETREISQMSWAVAHASRPPLALRNHLGDAIPPELEAIVMRCLQKHPGDRFPSVKALSEALQALPKDQNAETIHQVTPAFSGQTAPPVTQVASPAVRPTPVPLPYLPTEAAQKPVVTSPPTSPGRSPIQLAIAGFLLALTVAGIYLWSTKSQPTSPDPIASQSPKPEPLNQAKTLAKSGKLKEAIVTASQVPKDTPDYGEAQNLIQELSKQILGNSEKTFRSTNNETALDQALLQVQAIPNTSPLYAEGQTKTQQWQAEWTKAEEQLKQAKAAQEQQQWSSAIEITNALPNIRYWKEQVIPIATSAKAALETAPPATLPNTAPTNPEPPGDIAPAIPNRVEIDRAVAPAPAPALAPEPEPAPLPSTDWEAPTNPNTTPWEDGADNNAPASTPDNSGGI